MFKTSYPNKNSNQRFYLIGFQSLPIFLGRVLRWGLSIILSPSIPIWSFHAPNFSRFIWTNLEVISRDKSSCARVCVTRAYFYWLQMFGRRMLSMRENCTLHTHCDTFSLKICIFQQFPFVRSHFSVLDGPLVFYWSNNVKRCIS